MAASMLWKCLNVLYIPNKVFTGNTSLYCKRWKSFSTKVSWSDKHFFPPQFHLGFTSNTARSGAQTTSEALNCILNIFVCCNFSWGGLWFHLHSEIHVCCVSLSVVVETDKNYNFSAVRSPIELKLGGDLGLVSQISVHVLASRFDYFLGAKKRLYKRLR
jgi:hypothetical protein